MLLKCNAKINLGLSVISKRADGFHNLESIFLPIKWYDDIQLEEAKVTGFTAEGIQIDGKPENNLCLQAYHILAADFLLPPVHIHLNKQIPIGAGLGGGSSDGAFVLKGLNELFRLNLSVEKLESYAARLGSDCPFFIQNKTMFVSGRGEVLTPLDMELKGYCLVINPGIHISTKEAYRNVTPKPALCNLREAVEKPKENWQKEIVNDFEVALLPSYPSLQELRYKLKESGAYYVSMSGSGSTFFAFFEKEPKDLKIKEKYEYRLFKL